MELMWRHSIHTQTCWTTDWLVSIFTKTTCQTIQLFIVHANNWIDLPTLIIQRERERNTLFVCHDGWHLQFWLLVIILGMWIGTFLVITTSSGCPHLQCSDLCGTRSPGEVHWEMGPDCCKCIGSNLHCWTFSCCLRTALFLCQSHIFLFFSLFLGS